MPLGGGIFVEFMRLPHTGELNSYLVFRDGMGDARVIAGASESFTGDASGGLEIDQPVETSRAAYGPANSPRTRQAVKLPTGERAPEEVWRQMTAEAEALRRTGRVDNVMGNTKVVNAINRGLLDNAGVDWQSHIDVNKLSNMTGFDDASAEPVIQALRAARPPSQPEARFIRASFSPDTEKPEPVPAPTTIRATAQPPSQPEITPELSAKAEAESGGKGSTVLIGGSGVDDLREAMGEPRAIEGSRGLDDEAEDELSSPRTTGKPGSNDEPPAPSVMIDDHNLAEKKNEIFGENGVPYKAFGFSEEGVQKLGLAEDEFNGFLTRMVLSATSNDPADHIAMRREIAQTIGPRNRHVASRLGNWYSRLIQEGPGVFTPYRREVEREEGNKQNTPARSLLPELPDTVSEEEIKKWLHGRESLVELFGLDPERVKHIPKDKLDAMLVQILEARSRKDYNFTRAVENKMYKVFGIRGAAIRRHVNRVLEKDRDDVLPETFKNLPTEELIKKYKLMKRSQFAKEVGLAVVGTMGPLGSVASFAGSQRLGHQLTSLEKELFKRGICSTGLVQD